MKKSLQVAIGLQAIIMVLVNVPPLLVKATGTDVYLQTERVDPRSLFRGHYVTLRYPIAGLVSAPPQQARRIGLEKDNIVYITVTTDRPAKFVSSSENRPNLQPNEACLIGRYNYDWGANNVGIPQLEQFFAPKKEALLLQDLVGEELLAKAKTTKNCNAVLVGIESL